MGTRRDTGSSPASRGRIIQARLRMNGVMFGRFSVALMVLCAFAAPTYAAGDAWWLDAWPYRQVIQVTTPDPSGAINTALAIIDTDGKCFRGGRDVRVVDAANGTPAKYHVLSAEKGIVNAEFLVASAAAVRYHIYYGNAEARRESHQWERKLGGLVLTTYVNSRRQNAQSWQHMQELVQASSWKYGQGPRKQIYDVDNPFGPNDNYLGVYTGKIYCAKAGVYTFATNSDDSSFLLIDGRIVAQWPGGHDPLNAFDEKDNRAGRISLTAGIHAIQYYHVETKGAQLAKAGWRPPWAKRIKTIPEDVFVRELRTAILGRERRRSAMSAFFTVSPREEYQFTTLKQAFVNVQFESCTTSRFGKVALWWWDFGDGTTSRETNPRHQYMREGDYTVRHYCMDTLGFRDVCERVVSVKAEDPLRIEPFLEVLSKDPVLRPAQPVRLTLKSRCTGLEKWPCRLIVEVKTSRGRLIERKSSSVVLDSRQWRKSEETLESAFQTCTMTFRLVYEGTTLLERAVRIALAQSRTGPLKVKNEGLVSEQGERVLLRLSEDVVTPPLQSFADRMLAKKRVTVCVVDDSLAPRGEAEKQTYYGLMRDMVIEKFPERKVTLVRLGEEYVSHHDPLTRLGEIPGRVAGVTPDLVIVAGSMRDLTNYVPPARYERYLYALVDRLRGATDAEIMLLTPPPIIVNPDLSKRYAQRTMRVGLRRGLKVADAYSAFTRPSGGEAWRRHFRDPNDHDVYYLQPNLEGQRLIAKKIVRVLLSKN